MFTGIIEEVGRIRSQTNSGDSATLEIEGKKIFGDLEIGDSVAVNGVCLTATSIARNAFTADVMHETLNRSSLGAIGVGGKVNLERAMQMNGRFGGHIVSGHIDGTGKIVSLKYDSNAVWYKIQADSSIMRYVVEKGSIAIDGISLTVAKVYQNAFSVSIIPHTMDETTLGSKNPGDIVNLENDVIAKYVEKLLLRGVADDPRCVYSQLGSASASTDSLSGDGLDTPGWQDGLAWQGSMEGQDGQDGQDGGITMEFLAENGFL